MSLAVLMFISYISYQHMSVLSDTTKLVMHSYEVQVKLEQLFSCIKDAETGQRGYLVTKDKAFLEPYTGAFIQINRKNQELKSLLADNPEQIKRLQLLYYLIETRFSYFEKSLNQANFDLSSKEIINDNLLKGKIVMDRIRLDINEMIAIEKGFLEQRQYNYKNEISFTPFFTSLLLAFSLVVFIFSYVRINKDYFFLKKSNEKLQVANESMDHAEKIGKFSTWQWDLEKNKFTYSDNQFRLFGTEPQSFEPSTENFLKFVHPDDRHVIVKGGNEVISEKRLTPEFYRIIRTDGQIRYFKSIGKLLTNSDGKKTLVGINSDITDQHLSDIALKEQNFRLEQSIRELESFNHVASHDLQEPLRKIQTFLSRIPETDWNSLSDKGREFIIKSRTSAERMRSLIDDLLQFSSTNKNAEIFEQVNLNVLFENAKQELSTAIEDKQAIITADTFPEMKVIPFQIRQLFVNLIGNSLKYSREGIIPKIDITVENVSAKDYPSIRFNTEKRYFKFTFSDNGMGFEQQFAETIFILFNRLHTTDKFPGTGIGLAICKKIVENHAGFIEAKGNPNEGAVFTFFLPEYI